VSKKLINCDLGECLTPNLDQQIMPVIDMANIACGGHAGNDESMIKTIKLAVENNVTIGVHPSYKDKSNFGRVSFNLSSDELYDLIHAQVLHFQKLCTQNGAKLKYVKPHGALYHDMSNNQKVLDAMCKVIKAVDKNLALVVQAGDKNLGNNENVTFLHEVFADRGYDGIEMLARGKQGAVLGSPDAIVKQYQRFLSEKLFKIDTICFHSDNSASVEALKRLNHA